jgi:hypothetical protein
MANGGKRPGAGRKKAGHTIQAEAYRAYLVSEVMKNAKPIVAALIDKAKTGDVQAIKELHERAMGKVKDEMNLNANLKHSFDDIPESAYKAIIERESRRIKISGD